MTDLSKRGVTGRAYLPTAVNQPVPPVRPPSGAYQPPDGLIGVASAIPSSGASRFVPMTLVGGRAIDRLAVNVTTALVTSAGAVICQLGLYRSNSNGDGPDIPFGPLTQGAVSLAATGTAAATVAYTPTVTARFWPAFLYSINGATIGTAPQLSYVNQISWLWAASAQSLGSATRGLGYGTTLTALPSGAFTAVPALGGDVTVIYARAA